MSYQSHFDILLIISVFSNITGSDCQTFFCIKGTSTAFKHQDIFYIIVPQRKQYQCTLSGVKCQLFGTSLGSTSNIDYFALFFCLFFILQVLTIYLLEIPFMRDKWVL